MLGAATSHHSNFGSRFFITYRYVLFSRAHLLGTLFIFKLEKVLVFRRCITENFSLKGSEFFGSYMRPGFYCI